MQTILVTGGCGYIGSHTALELLNKNYQVVVVDNFSNSSFESLRRVQKITGKEVIFYEADVRDREAMEKIFLPTIESLNREGIEYKGVIYFGLMMTEKGVKVIEYNARFGDPETQAILPLLETDLCDIIDACIDGTLDSLDIKWKDKTGFTVVIASGEYPENVVKGYPIEIGDLDGVTLYHAGSAIKDGVMVTNGGRVFAMTAVANDIDDARKVVYSQIDKVKFTGARYRSDIGKV